MPAVAVQGNFSADSIARVDYEIKYENEADTQYADMFAATSLDVTETVATPNTDYTLNAGRSVSDSQQEEVTATQQVFMNIDSPGQWRAYQAKRGKKRIAYRRTTYGRQLGSDITLSATQTLAISAAGVLTYGGSASATLKGLVEANLKRGNIIKIGTNYYFVQRVLTRAGGGIADNGVIIGSSPTDQDDFPFRSGTAVTAVNSGMVKIFDVRKVITVWRGTVTQAPLPSDQPAGAGGSERVQSTISYAFDDLGTITFADPTAAESA